MLFSCQKSSAFYGVPPGWVGLHLRSAQSSAPSDGSFDRYRKTVVAVDAQLRAVRRACDRLEIETFGGAERDRTADPLVANQVLSQLSYSPTIGVKLVGLGRVELPTSPLSGVRSSQLSYRPGFLFRNSSVLTLQFRTIY